MEKDFSLRRLLLRVSPKPELRVICVGDYGEKKNLGLRRTNDKVIKSGEKKRRVCTL